MHHFHADDTQIYLRLDEGNCDSNLSELSSCLDPVQAWMGNSMLKLNPDKTEFILLGNSSARDELSSFFPSNLLGNEVTPTDKVKKLGVHFDSDLSFDTHIDMFASHPTITKRTFAEFVIPSVKTLMSRSPML